MTSDQRFYLRLKFVNYAHGFLRCDSGTWAEGVCSELFTATRSKSNPWAAWPFMPNFLLFYLLIKNMTFFS